MRTLFLIAAMLVLMFFAAPAKACNPVPVQFAAGGYGGQQFLADGGCQQQFFAAPAPCYGGVQSFQRFSGGYGRAFAVPVPVRRPFFFSRAFVPTFGGLHAAAAVSFGF